MLIGVSGCLPTLPPAFPMDFPENAGNLIHARAPIEMFEQTVTPDSSWQARGSSFPEFVNANCEKVVVTMDNRLRVGEQHGERYTATMRLLEAFDVPIVIFGIGAQSPDQDLTGLTMAPEAIRLMQFLGERCGPVGVRGEFTAEVFRHFAGVSNTYVTGCPSFFSRPQAFASLRTNLKNERMGRPSYAGTAYHNDAETQMLERAIAADTFLVEPVNRWNHGYHLAASRGQDSAEIPYFLRAAVREGRLDVEQVRNFYRCNYRLFRDATPWYEFNDELVSYTFGSRFHVNMASLLAGKPAVWVTHDARTQELCSFLRLPRVPLETATDMTPEDFNALISYDEVFDHLPELFANFNGYLEVHGLPRVRPPF